MIDQQVAHELSQLLQQASAGCQQMIAANPTDPMPLNNAMIAIEQQKKAIDRKLWDAPNVDKRTKRACGRWIDETWARFETHWHVEQLRAMWPHVQHAMQKPATCTQCGSPLGRATPYKSESITCGGCHSVNQVMPETVVATYFGSIPHWFAEQATLDKKLALQKFKDDWEEHRDASFAAGHDRPDEPLERLKQREQMERDYWTSYAEARVRNEGGTAADVKSLVDARMKQCFYDEMNMNDVWRAAHGQRSVVEQVRVPAHLQNVDEWGPLNPHQNPNALEDDWVHEQLLSEAMREPERHAALLTTLGYRDATHRAMVHQTFMRHYHDYITSPQGQQLITKAAMRAMNERMKYATASAAAGGILDAIEGVSLQTYAQLQAKQAGGDPDAFTKLLAQNQMDRAKWERVSKAWLDRMSRDTTGAIATEYAKAFSGQGQFGGMGAAAADVMANGQMGLSGPSTGGGAGGEPVSFDRYCEISGAMSAWTKQGKDISAGLHKHFQMSAIDFSNVGMYWSQKMMADLSMFDTQSKLVAQYEQKYLAMA